MPAIFLVCIAITLNSYPVEFDLSFTHTESLGRPVTLKRHMFRSICEGSNTNEKKLVAIKIKLHNY
jgi:hypothetical protein